MSEGRTKRGIPLRSTLGMRTSPDLHSWILVADRSQLRLFEKNQQVTPATLDLKVHWENPDGRLKARDLLSDRPGRSFDSQDRSHHGQTGGARHSYGEGSDPTQQIIQELVKHAVRLVEGTDFGKPGSRLWVVAEPRLLGLLRASLDGMFPKAEVFFFDKDFAWLSGPNLQARLHELSHSPSR